MTLFRGMGALAWAYWLETWRVKPAIFWNLVMPLIFVIGLSYIFGAGETERVRVILPGIMTINLIAASFFGISLYMVSLREIGLYRRYRVTPVSSLTIVSAHAVTALVNIGISMVLQLLAARLIFGLQVQGSIIELALAILLSAFAFIPLGLIVGSIAGDMKTAPALSNLLFFPMMFLSGAALPLFLMPDWLKQLAALLPATYVVEVLQGVIIRSDAFDRFSLPVGVLIATGIIAFAFNTMLFRWETSEPISRRGLVSVLVALVAVYAAVFSTGVTLKSATKPEVPNVPSSKANTGTQVFSGMTIFDGMGTRIDNGRVTIEGDRIIAVGTDAGKVVAEGVAIQDHTGMYMIPGLIDSHIHIGGSAGGAASVGEFLPSRVIRDLQVYLALGVTAFVSMTDDIDDLARLHKAVATNQMRAPRPFFSGPAITASGGHPAFIFRQVPGLAERMTYQVNTAEAAVKGVRELAQKRVDFIKLVLEKGWIGTPLPVLAESVFRAAVRTARELGIRTAVHVDSDESARLAIDAGANSLQHVPADLTEETMAIMIEKGVSLTPTLAALEGLVKSIRMDAITDPLVLEWSDLKIIESLKSPDSWLAKYRHSPETVAYHVQRYARALNMVRKAVDMGVWIIAGSDAGNPASFHGPGLIRELELLVEECGMTPSDAIVAATGAAAKNLGKTDIGRIVPGALADFVILGSDPASNIRALRDVRQIYFRGKLIARQTLFSTSPGGWMPGQQ